MADLEIAMKASPRQHGYIRMSAIRALCLGFSHSHAAALHNVSERTITRWVNSFDERGVDGLIDVPEQVGPGRSALKKAPNIET